MPQETALAPTSLLKFNLKPGLAAVHRLIRLSDDAYICKKLYVPGNITAPHPLNMLMLYNFEL
jgi:hypothetical protein